MKVIASKSDFAKIVVLSQDQFRCGLKKKIQV